MDCRRQLTRMLALLACLSVQPCLAWQWQDWMGSSKPDPAPAIGEIEDPASSALIEPLEMGLVTRAAPQRGFQLFPAGLMYHSYLAGPKESRINAVWMRDNHGKLNWETQLGGRVGIIRYGDFASINPNGWQFDMEGGAQTRVLPDNDSDLEAADFRIGFLLTTRRNLWATKTGYYHLSSHAGDEFLLDNPTFTRINYVRDSVIFGVSRDVLWKGRPDFRLYAECAYAVSHEFARPWEFQTGAEYSPLVFNGFRGTPFFAVNGHFREDRNWDATGICVSTGWQWRSPATNRRFRIGVQYYSGDSLQWEFAGSKESSFGWGMWFDY